MMSSPESMKPCALDANGTAIATGCLADKTATAAAAANKPTEPTNNNSSSSRGTNAPVSMVSMPVLALSSHTISPLSSTPTLTSELVELVTGISLRLLPGKFYLPADPAVSHPLNVLSRSIMPMPSKVALMLLPTVTLDAAAECAGDQTQLLNMMAQLAAAPCRRPVSYTATLLALAAEKGALAVLQWWFNNKDSVPLLCDTDNVIHQALTFRHAHVLDWCVEQGFKIPTEDLAVVWGSDKVDILDWCVAYEVPLVDYERATEDASENGDVHVLAWWKASGLPLKYSHRALERAIMGQHCAVVLEWWADSGLKLYGDELQLTRIAVQRCDMFALEWLAKNGLLLVHSTLLVDLFAAEDLAVIKWCMGRFKMQPSSLGLNMDVWIPASKHSMAHALDLADELGFVMPSATDISSCLEAAARVGSVAVLDWWLWKFPTLSSNRFEPALNAAAAKGHVPVLDWIKQHGYFDQDQDPDMPSLTLAAKGGHLDVLKWFAQHPRCACGSPTHNAFSSSVYLAAAENGHVDIVRWWRKSGMPIPPFASLGSVGRQSFLDAARSGHGAVLKSWVDAWLQSSGDNLANVSMSLVKDTLFHLLRSTNPESFTYLKWWISISGCRSHADLEEMMGVACQLNKVQVLDWMLEAQLLDPEHDDYDGLFVAAQHGCVEAMDWLVAYAGAVQPSFDAVDCFATGVSDLYLVCHWLAHNASKLKMEPCELPIELIDTLGSAGLVDRVLRLGVLTVPESYSIYDEASMGGSVDVLKWWYATDLADKKDKQYSKEALLQASLAPNLHILDWWRMMSVDGPCTRLSGPLKLKLPFRSLDAMMARRDIVPEAVEWWIASGLLPETAPESDHDSGDEGDGAEDEDEGSDSDGDGEEEDQEEDPMAVDTDIGAGW